jgi:DNA-binding YbaB/EbfC family protein
MMDRKMLKQIEDMQKKMVKAQEDLANETVSASAGGGAVTVEMTGHHQVVAVTIDKDAVDPDDVETLQDMVLSAFNAALEKAQALQQDKLGSIAGGLPPGLF